MLAQRVWRALSWAADLLRADGSAELLLDHSAEAVGTIGLLVLDVSADCIGFGRVDGLRDKLAIGLLARSRVGAESQHGGMWCQQRVGQAQGKAAVA